MSTSESGQPLEVVGTDDVPYYRSFGIPHTMHECKADRLQPRIKASCLLQCANLCMTSTDYDFRRVRRVNAVGVQPRYGWISPASIPRWRDE